jgi:hypothetical protein
MESCSQEEIKNKTGRDAKGRWIKGFCPNPKGNTKQYLLDDLIDALEKESKRQHYTNFVEVVAKRALQYETVLIAVLKKICPDKIQGEGIAPTTIQVVHVHPYARDPERDESQVQDSELGLSQDRTSMAEGSQG